MISFDDFKKVELTVGKILSAEKVPETEKLLKLVVDFGPSPLEKGALPTPPARGGVSSLRDGVVGAAGGLSTTPASEDGGTPFVKGDGDTTTPQSPPSEPLRLADSALPLRKGGEGGEEIPRLADGILPFTKGESDKDIRQIVSGIAMYFPEPQTLVGRKYMFVTNIPPRQIKGLESNGMILAVSTDAGKFSLLEPGGGVPEGTRAQ